MKTFVYIKRSIMCVFLVAFLSILCSCANRKMLDAPVEIKIDNGFIMFQSVGSARGYELLVEQGEDIHEHEIESGFDLNRILEHDHNYVLQVRTLGNNIDFLDSQYSKPIDYTHRIRLLDARRLSDPSFITWRGRVEPVSNRIYFNNTASGFQVSFYGTVLSAILSTDRAEDEQYRPYLTIMVDDQDDPLKTEIFPLDRLTGSYSLISDLEPGYHTVTLYKRSEAVSSKSALLNLSTDGFFVEQNPENRPLFVVYGDSLTTGYGNVDSIAIDPYETRSQDGLLTYAALTARMFDADLEVVAVSGIGMTFGFRGYTMPEIYDRITPNEASTWDFSKSAPELVIVSLGANDNSVLNVLAEDERVAGLIRFKEDYRQFIMTLKGRYPDVPIVLITIGAGQNLVKPRIIELTEELGDLGVYHVPLTTIYLSDGLGAGFHPTYRTHIRQADHLATSLSDLFSLEPKRANIEP